MPNQGMTAEVAVASPLPDDGKVVDAGWKFQPPALLSVQQTAWFLFGLDDRTAQKRVRRMQDEGTIKYFVQGRRKWTPWSEIQRLAKKKDVIDDDT